MSGIHAAFLYPVKVGHNRTSPSQTSGGHLQSVIDKAGRVDVSFNATGIPNTTLPGVPLVDRAIEQFACRSRPMRGRTF